MSRGQRRPLDALIYERPSCVSSEKNHSLHFQDHCCQHNLEERRERRERGERGGREEGEEGEEEERREKGGKEEGERRERGGEKRGKGVRMHMYCIIAISHLPNSDVSGPI